MFCTILYSVIRQCSHFLTGSISRHWMAHLRHVLQTVQFYCQPWINKPQTAVLLGVYHWSITLRLLREYPPINKPWFINPGLTSSGKQPWSPVLVAFWCRVTSQRRRVPAQGGLFRPGLSQGNWVRWRTQPFLVWLSQLQRGLRLCKVHQSVSLMAHWWQIIGALHLNILPTPNPDMKCRQWGQRITHWEKLPAAWGASCVFRAPLLDAFNFDQFSRLSRNCQH